MAYTELIKNFERIRDYMREFYVYGFKSRSEFEKKSPRSYDNERRRIENYLGDYMGFRQRTGGKTVFLSIDSRNAHHNPFYKALKAKSFTDADITLHFIIFDILYYPETSLTLNEITEIIDREYLSAFEAPMLFDKSTLRKKLKEYVDMGLIGFRKQGKEVFYHTFSSPNLEGWGDALAFFSETAMCGVVGNFLLDKIEDIPEYYAFKHHYITHALESEVLYELLKAMGEKRKVTLKNCIEGSGITVKREVVPLKIFISAQNGRHYLMGYIMASGEIKSFRLDYISGVKAGGAAEDFERLREKLEKLQSGMWGVSCSSRHMREHVEFTVFIGEQEEHIYHRLEREKRCGSVERVDRNTARFTADVIDSGELIPWIRTFICRITSMNFSNRAVENQFKKDIETMYELYGLGGEA